MYFILIKSLHGHKRVLCFRRWGYVGYMEHGNQIQNQISAKLSSIYEYTIHWRVQIFYCASIITPVIFLYYTSLPFKCWKDIIILTHARDNKTEMKIRKYPLINILACLSTDPIPVHTQQHIHYAICKLSRSLLTKALMHYCSGATLSMTLSYIV